MSTITLPAQTIEIQDGPVSLAHAIENMDTAGYYAANLKLPATTVLGGDVSYDDFYDGLAEALVSDSEASDLRFTVLGASANGAELFLRVSNCIADMADLDEDTLNEKVTADTLDAAFARLVVRPVSYSNTPTKDSLS